MAKTSTYPSPLASLTGGGKRATNRQKVESMRGYTTGRSVGDFFAAQSESPFLRSLYQYTKTMKMRKQAAGGGGESGDDQPQERGGDTSREGIKSIQSLRRKLATVEKVTIENQKDTKEIIRAIAEVKKGILGIRSAIKNFKGSLDKITSSITPSPQTSLAGSAAKIYSTAGADTKELLKPIDVTSPQGESYLYYRGAPQGRQFYKRGKEGTAGPIASREMSGDLMRAVEQKLAAISAKMNGDDKTAKVLSPKDYGQVKEVDNREETEKLEKALEEALKKVLPGALSEAGVGEQMAMLGGSGGGLADSLIGGGLVRGAIGLASGAARGAAALGRGAIQGAKGLATKIGGFMRGGATPEITPTMPTTTPSTTPTTVPTAEAAKRAAEQTAGATATKGAAEAGEKAAAKAAEKAGAKTAAKAAGKTVLKSVLKKIPLIGALAGLGFGAQRAMSGDFTGAAMEVGSGIAGTLPGLGTAASVALDAGLAAKDMGMFNKTATPNPVRNDLPATIVERSSANLRAGQQAAPPVIVNAPTTNPAPPPPPQKPMSAIPVVRNPDDAFIRATAKDFYHPSSTYK